MKTMENSLWLKLTLLLVSSLTIMSIITISPALPQMATVFSGTAHAAFWVKLVLTIPALTIALFSPLTGRLIDQYGRLRLLQFSLLLYAVCGSAGFYLTGLYGILVSRALLGVSVGISMPVVITLIADYFDGIQRQKFVGIQVAFMSLGGILFVGLGGVLADVGWRYPFLIYPVSVLILPLTFFFLYEPARIPPQAGSGEPLTAVPAFIRLLFFNTLLMWLLFFLIPVQLPFYLTAMGIKSNALIGAAIAASTASSAVSSIAYSWLKTRLSFLAVFAIGYLLMAFAFACLSLAGSYNMVLCAMLLSGLGLGMMIPNTNMWVMKITPPAVRGREIGKLTTFWFLGQFLSPVITFPLVIALPLSSVFFCVALFILLLSLVFGMLHFSKKGKEASALSAASA